MKSAFKFLNLAADRAARICTATMAALSLVTPAAFAAEIFGNQGIRLDVDTVVEFEFLESNGSYQSVFGIVNMQTGEKFPLYGEVKGADALQPVAVPSDYQEE